MKKLFLLIAVGLLLCVAMTNTANALRLDLWNNFPDAQGQNGFYAYAYNPQTGAYRSLQRASAYSFKTINQPWTVPLVQRGPATAFVDDGAAIDAYSVELHPTNASNQCGTIYGTEDGILAWKSTQTGMYDISGKFSTDGYATVNVYIKKNNTVLWSRNLANGATSLFDLKNIYLGAGDTLYYGTNNFDNSDHYDHTWLSGTIATSAYPTAVITPNSTQTITDYVNLGLKTVTLNGSNSKNSSGQVGSGLTYSWAQSIQGAHQADPHVTIDAPGSAVTTFQVPDLDSGTANLSFTLTVTEIVAGYPLTNSAGCNVNITYAQDVPEISVSAPSSAAEGSSVVLDGSASHTTASPASSGLTFNWTQKADDAYQVALNNSTESISNFDAPLVGTAGAVLHFTLTITDTAGLTVSTPVIVNINNIPPEAAIAGPVGINEKASVTLTSACTAAGNPIATYEWLLTDTQSGDTALDTSNIVLSQTDTQTFTAPEVGPRGGSLTFQLKVTDSAGSVVLSNPLVIAIANVNAPPIADAGPDFTIEQTSPAGASCTLNGTGSSDPDNDPLTYSWRWAGGSATGVNPTVQLPAGVNIVVLTVTDSSDASNSATVRITVKDTTAPVVTAPASVTAEATGASTAVAIGVATATDAVGVVSLTNDAPAAFPVGSTTVTWTAKDAAGNAGTAAQTVTVKDTTAPLVTAPAAVTAEATGASTAVAIGVATATDAVGVVSLTNDAPAAFPVGSTTVTWTAKDAAGNAGTATQTVTVKDTAAPAFTYVPADVIKLATGVLTSVDIGQARATDAVGAVVSNDAPSAGFPVGATVVTWTAKDAAGNTTTAVQKVTVWQYAFSGVLEPVNNDGSSVFKQGRTIPVKFQIRDLNGAYVSNASIPIRAYKVSDSVAGGADEAVSTSAATSGNLFRYDSTANQYIFNLNTKGMTTGTHQISIALGDGTVRTVLISLR